MIPIKDEHKIFVYFKHRNENQIHALNYIIKLRDEILTLKHAIYFIEECIYIEYIYIYIYIYMVWIGHVNLSVDF